MMLKCKKQFIALFMAISVIFCVGSETYIKAEALEWAIPTITAGEALKWLLGLLGVTVAGGALANTDYDQLVENYNDFAEIKGVSAVEQGKFWEDVIKGSLNTGSKAWATFKEWVETLPNKITANLNSYTIDDFANSLGVVINNPNNYDLTGFKFSLIQASYSNPWESNTYYLQNATKIETTSGSLYITYTMGISLQKISNNIFEIRNITKFDSAHRTEISNSKNNAYMWFSSFLLTDLAYPIYIPTFEFPFSSDSIAFNKFMDNISDIGLIVSSAISDAIPDVIPLPWNQVAGTAEGINDKIDELIEKVNEGVLTLEDYMVAIQAILGVIAFDTTNDLVIPSDPDLPDETIQDKINENVNNNGFVLSGLENFFPFCIPFDIYSFITILVADPVAPVIHWHIYNPVTKTDNIMTLDFSMWEPVVILFRYIFDFLFIIGLALIARSLIGGDD